MTNAICETPWQLNLVCGQRTFHARISILILIHILSFSLSLSLPLFLLCWSQYRMFPFPEIIFLYVGVYVLYSTVKHGTPQAYLRRLWDLKLFGWVFSFSLMLYSWLSSSCGLSPLLLYFIFYYFYSCLTLSFCVSFSCCLLFSCCLFFFLFMYLFLCMSLFLLFLLFLWKFSHGNKSVQFFLQRMR